MREAAAAEERLPRDFKLGQYIEAYKAASARVRYACVVLMVVVGVALAGFWNSYPQSWYSSRLDKTREALLLAERCDGLSDWHAREACREEAADENRVFKVLGGKAKFIEARLEGLEQGYTQRILLMHFPVLGPAFDLNDLGLFSGIILLLVMGYFTVSIDREYETLCLALWKVEQLALEEPRRNIPDGDANLLYHALAMIPVLCTPPSLIRWTVSPMNQVARFCLLMPAAAHTMIVATNLLTSEIGHAYRPGFPTVGLPVQVGSALVLWWLGVVCWIYARASHGRWRRAFVKVNPGLTRVPPYAWRVRLLLKKPDLLLKRRVKKILYPPQR